MFVIMLIFVIDIKEIRETFLSTWRFAKTFVAARKVHGYRERFLFSCNKFRNWRFPRTKKSKNAFKLFNYRCLSISIVTILVNTYRFVFTLQRYKKMENKQNQWLTLNGGCVYFEQ